MRHGLTCAFVVGCIIRVLLLALAFVVGESGRIAQGKRDNKFSALQTLDELTAMVDQETKNLAKRAAKVALGQECSAGSAAVTGSLVLASSGKGQSTTPQKGSRGRKHATDAYSAIEIVEGSSKKTALNDINLAFIMWGHSQKVQVAGVLVLAVRLPISACFVPVIFS